MVKGNVLRERVCCINLKNNRREVDESHMDTTWFYFIIKDITHFEDLPLSIKRRRKTRIRNLSFILNTMLAEQGERQKKKNQRKTKQNKKKRKKIEL